MTLVAVVLLCLILASSIPVAAGMAMTGLILQHLYSPLPLSVIIGELAWSTMTSPILAAVPYYILFGEILLRSGIAERMYAAMMKWLSWLPGGLMHANIGACALFGSVSGSSVATAVTVGVVALDEMKKYRYHEPLYLGTLAAGGTLGILIPPSINMIVYGVMTETSVPQLYLAGFLPGAILTLLFTLTVLALCWWRPHYGGTRIQASWAARIRCLPDLLPPTVLLLVVIGVILFGVATATESAAIGILGALAIVAWRRRLTWRMLLESFEGTVRTTAMVVAILVGAFFLNVVINAIGLTQQISKLINEAKLTPGQILFTIILIYLVLGTFMEEMSMMVGTIPITFPIMMQAGFDPVWYGVLIVLLVQTAMITPPFGINLFVIHGIRGRGQLHDVMNGSAPFVVALVLMIALICLWPEIVMWAPHAWKGQ